MPGGHKAFSVRTTLTASFFWVKRPCVFSEWGNLPEVQKKPWNHHAPSSDSNEDHEYFEGDPERSHAAHASASCFFFGILGPLQCTFLWKNKIIVLVHKNLVDLIATISVPRDCSTRSFCCCKGMVMYQPVEESLWKPSSRYGCFLK